MDCQKKAICEVYQNQRQLGAISQRARHSLDYLETLSYFSLPDEFINVIDEFMVKQRRVSRRVLWNSISDTVTTVTWVAELKAAFIY